LDIFQGFLGEEELQMNSCKMTGLGMMALCAGVAGMTVTPAKAGAITGVTGGFQDYTTSNGTVTGLMGKINIQQNAGTGDVTITFLQGVNDNVYGTSASTDPMWGSKGHTFSNLLGSDKAEFIVYGGSTALLDVTIDYIAAVNGTLSWVTVDGTMAKTYGSGYGSAGFFINNKSSPAITSSDGSLNSGNSKYVLNFDTTLTDDLNQSPAYYGDTTNSPVGDPNWNNVNGYSLTIAGQLFTDNSKSFGGVNLSLVHDSPQGAYETPSITTAAPLPSSAWSGVGLIGLLAGTKLSRRLRRSRNELA